MIDFAHWYLGGVAAVSGDLPILIDQSGRTETPASAGQRCLLDPSSRYLRCRAVPEQKSMSAASASSPIKSSDSLFNSLVIKERSRASTSSSALTAG
jgi:hypothetical protein